MMTAALIGVACIWIYSLCWLVCAASGLYILCTGRFSYRDRPFAWLDRERKVKIIEGREATREGMIRLAGGLFLGIVPLLLALKVTPSVMEAALAGAVK